MSKCKGCGKVLTGKYANYVRCYVCNLKNKSIWNCDFCRGSGKRYVCDEVYLPCDCEYGLYLQK